MREVTPWKWIAGGVIATLGCGLVGWMVFRGPPSLPEPGRSRDLPVAGPVVAVTSPQDLQATGQPNDWISSEQGKNWVRSIER